MGKISSILFYVGDAFLFLIGLIHLVTHFVGSPEPANTEQKTFLDLFKSTQFKMPSGESRTYEDIFNAFSLYFGILVIGMAIMMWISSRHQETHRPSMIVGAIIMFITAAVTFKYAILPPLVMMLIVAVCFAGAFLFSKPSN